MTGSAEGFGSWLIVYSGRANATRYHYDDRNLTLFTTYRYRLTVYNEYLPTVGPASSDVATFGGVPRRPANVSAQTVNHTSIHVNWSLPSESSSPSPSITIISIIVIIIIVMYALPAWGGYVSRENISRIDKMLHKARRYGFTSTLHCFEELLEQADDRLFSGTVCSNHC